jgi:hypothetical protein
MTFSISRLRNIQHGYLFPLLPVVFLNTNIPLIFLSTLPCFLGIRKNLKGLDNIYSGRCVHVCVCVCVCVCLHVCGRVHVCVSFHVCVCVCSCVCVCVCLCVCVWKGDKILNAPIRNQLYLTHGSFRILKCKINWHII